MKSLFISAVIWKIWAESWSVYPTDNQCHNPLSGCSGWWVSIADFQGWHFIYMCSVWTSSIPRYNTVHQCKCCWLQQRQISFAVELLSRKPGPVYTTMVSCHSAAVTIHCQRTISFYYQPVTKQEMYTSEQNKSEPINICTISCSLRII